MTLCFYVLFRKLRFLRTNVKLRFSLPAEYKCQIFSLRFMISKISSQLTAGRIYAHLYPMCPGNNLLINNWRGAQGRPNIIVLPGGCGVTLPRRPPIFSSGISGGRDWMGKNRNMPSKVKVTQGR